ncbi:MAG: peptide chain release factor N(5)-glutamine methyltransferase, partial [Acutalibacteraceae bacterium]|nr:peptide chain release factor N(5)-glutamine methyltransferase [Acutalibacteraceae bacterium]
MSIRSLYNEARQALGAASDDPAFEAACLMQRFFGMDRAAVLTHGAREPDPAAEAEFRAAVGRRTAGEPLQYILGEWDFMALTLRCGPGVLIPRDDTAVLVEAAAERLQGAQAPRGLDLCAGTGAVGL